MYVLKHTCDLIVHAVARYQELHIVKAWDTDKDWERIGEFGTEAVAREYIVVFRPLWILSYHCCKIVETGGCRRLIQVRS
eukprot:4951276-Karenia_brevis.AAC.1